MAGTNIGLTDRSITSLSGSSQQLMPQNTQRSLLIIENTGNANIGVNLAAGTAAIGGTGTITLVPNGSIIIDSQAVPFQQINVIGTAGQSVTAFEG